MNPEIQQWAQTPEAQPYLQRAQSEGRGGYGGDMFSTLLPLLEAGQGNNKMMEMLLPLLIQSMMPEYGREQGYMEEDRNTQKAYDYMTRAESERDPVTGQLSLRGEQIMQEADRLLGVPSTDIGGYGGLEQKAYEATRADIEARYLEAHNRGDVEAMNQIGEVYEMGLQDPSVYDAWQQKPTWGERFGNLGFGGGAQGAAGTGLGVLGGAKVGAKAGALSGAIGGPKGALIGGAVGGIGGGLYGLRGLWDDESIKLNRDYSGYGTPSIN